MEQKIPTSDSYSKKKLLNTSLYEDSKILIKKIFKNFLFLFVNFFY